MATTNKKKPLNGPDPVNNILHYDDTESRISYLESLARRYEHSHALDEAYAKGIKKGKDVSFWPTFAFGVIYGIVVYYSLFTKKGTMPGNVIGFKGI